MNIKLIQRLLTLIVIFSLSCNFFTGITPDLGTSEPNIQPLIATGNGPSGFTAEATSADSVMLSWQTVEGAISYHLVVSTNNGEALTVIDLTSSSTSYEDFLVAPGSQLTYAVEALGESGSIGQSIVSVTTPARQPNPIQVLVEFDISASVSQTIGPSGGVVSIVDANGVFYELSIPPNALDVDVEITLTPVTDLSDWPLDGAMLGAIGIDPEGLTLNVPAYLTITPSSEVAIDGLATVGFVFQGYGSEFALQPLTNADVQSSSMPGGITHFARPVQQTPRIITLPMTDLTPKGVGQVSPQRAGEIVKQNPPSGSADAMDQKQVAASLGDDELTPLPVFPWETMFNNYLRKIKQATDCKELRRALSSLNEARYEADRADARGEWRVEQENKAWDETLEKTKEILDKAAEECKQKKKNEATSAPCAYGILRSIASGGNLLFKEFQKRMIEKYGKDVINKYDEKIKKACRPGYLMAGGTEGLKVNDKVCDITKPFSVNGSVYGGSLKITFTPKSPEKEGVVPAGGSYEYTGSGAGFAANGNGSFFMMGNLESDIKLEAFGPGQVAEWGATGGESYVLTRRDYFCGSND